MASGQFSRGQFGPKQFEIITRFVFKPQLFNTVIVVGVFGLNITQLISYSHFIFYHIRSVGDGFKKCDIAYGINA